MVALDIRLFILIFTIVINLLLATFVYKNNPKSATNKIFGLLAIVSTVWLIDVHVSVSPEYFSNALLWVRLSIFFAVAQVILFFLLAHTFPSEKLLLKRKKFYLLISSVILMMFYTLSPLVFSSVELGDNAVIATPRPGIALFTIYVVSFTIAAIIVLLKKRSNSHGKLREQYQYIVTGEILMQGLLILTVLLPVAISKNSFFVQFVPIYTVLYLSTITFAIIKKKLFDIRAAVARSVVYLLSLGFIGIIYGGVIIIISSAFSFEMLSNSIQRSIYVGLAIVTAVFYPSVKKFFARVTTKIFYQDAYDPQVFLDSLNKILVSRVDLEPLLQDVADLIESNIKADYCVFTIRESAYYPSRTIGTKSKQFSIEDAGVLHNLTPKIHHKVLITDELSEEQVDLKTVLSKYDVSVLARLVSTVKLDVEGIGYLVLGPKKSGNIYTKQDEDIIRIIANELVIAIENAMKFEEIQKFNETLQEKIETATRQLRTTNEKLKALDETKDEFISMASHQLRTPLTSVKGYLSMVLEGDAGDVNEMQNKLLNQAFVSSQRMVYLIADLLNVSRLRTGKFIIEAVASNLADVIEGEYNQLKDTAKSRGLTLTYTKPENFPTLLLDETKIRQVIMNFMDNAIYYTPKGGHIDVALKETDKTIEYTVTDDGIGVPKAELHHLFTKFYRAGNAKKSRPDGTGLGLFMAKKVIIAQGGSIILNSEEGKGSTFGFAFDKSKLQSKAESETKEIAAEVEAETDSEKSPDEQKETEA